MTMYPYEDLLLRNIKGERWKGVPADEGYYKVSNLGSVKSIDRIVPHPRIHHQFVKGRVLRQKIVRDFNKHTGDDMVSLQVSLMMEGEMHFYNVRRLVYAAFKQFIDFKKDGMYVINKDGNGFNNRAGNLRLVSKSEKQQRSVKSGRNNFEYLKALDRSGWKKSCSGRIAVDQYAIGGSLLRKYKSITEAHDATGIDAKGISNAAKGHYRNIWSGYEWHFPESREMKGD